MRVITKKIWYVDFPTYQYNEDAIALAKENNLEIIDSRHKGKPTGKDIATDTPKLTIKGTLEPLKEVTFDEPIEEPTEEPTEEPKKRGRPKKA